MVVGKYVYSPITSWVIDGCYEEGAAQKNLFWTALLSSRLLHLPVVYVVDAKLSAITRKLQSLAEQVLTGNLTNQKQRYFSIMDTDSWRRMAEQSSYYTYLKSAWSQGRIHMWYIVMYIVSVNKCMWSKKAGKCKCATFILKANGISFLFEFHFLRFSGCLQASWHLTCKQRMTPATCLWPKQSGGFQCSTNFVTHFTSGNYSPTVQKISHCTKHL